MAGQSWNNIISYVKLNLGAPLNLIEIPDDDLINNLKEHVLPVFSQYAPYKKYCFINGANIKPSTNLGDPRFKYELPLEIDEYVIDVAAVHSTRSTLMTEDYGMSMVNHFGAIDAVIANTYIDAIQYLGVRNTWEFQPPNIIIMDQEIYGGVVEYFTPHNTLNTMRPDLYTLQFKRMCLAQTMLWLSAMRSKYENLATPFGPLPINWQDMKSDGQRIMDEVNQQLAALPPDPLIEIS